MRPYFVLLVVSPHGCAFGRRVYLRCPGLVQAQGEAKVLPWDSNMADNCTVMGGVRYSTLPSAFTRNGLSWPG